jgi:hypothetical protein
MKKESHCKSRFPAAESAVDLASSDPDAGGLTNVAADKHFSDAASPQWL